MALWHIPGQGIVDDAQEGISIPEPGEITLPSGEKITWGVQGTAKLPEFRNTWQYGRDAFQWDPTNYGAGQGPSGSYNVGYIPQLIDMAATAELGPLTPLQQEQWEQMRAQALATPTRDISQLQAGYPGEGGDLSRYLTPASPDAGAVMLTLRDKIMQGQASAQERGLYNTFLAQMREQDVRANVPQASDAFNPLGDQFFGALGVLGLGATGGLAAAPLFAGGAGLATTLGSLGTLSGIAGTGAGVLGQATDQPWLRNLGLGLGIAGGLAGGIGGLSNVLGSGVHSLSDAARLAQSAGKITGSLGRIPGADPLKQASRYLGLAGQLGQGASGAWDLFSGEGDGGALRSVLGGLGAAGNLGSTFLRRGGGGPPPGTMAPRPVAAQRAPALMAGGPPMRPQAQAPATGGMPWQSTVPLLMQLAQAAQGRR
jgi:hypothetical protein